MHRSLSISTLGITAALFLILSIALGLSLFVGYWLLKPETIFSSVTSPNHTYTVELKGSKTRPLLIPHEVRVDVLKTGQPFASDIWLHSAQDSFDLSFEAGYPDLRWLNDNLVEFYRQEYFEKGSDSLTTRNTSLKPIKYIRVQSVNKFLLFDFEPGTSVSMKIPAPRGDWQSIAVEGMFTDGQFIPFQHKSFDRRATQSNSFNYQLEITASGSLLEAEEQSTGPR